MKTKYQVQVIARLSAFALIPIELDDHDPDEAIKKAEAIMDERLRSFENREPQFHLAKEESHETCIVTTEDDEAAMMDLL